MSLRSWVWCILALCVLVSCDEETSKTSMDTLSDSDVAVLDSDRLCGTVACSDAQTCCDFECVDLEEDTGHCGTCGNACGTGESCSAGECRCGGETCTSDELCCGPLVGCVTASSDPQHCGACGNVCADTESCSAGLCLCEGPEGPEQCRTGESCCPGTGCVEVAGDPEHCGACGQACGGGERCDGGTCLCGDAVACGDGELCCGETPTCMAADAPQCQCGDTACSAGQGCCDVEGTEQCTPTTRNEQNCGACGVTCTEREECQGGGCQCFRNFADCDGDAGNGCEVRLNAEFSNCSSCGLSCEPGEVCDGLGQCAKRCQVGLTNCSGSCYNLNTDRENCGACGLVCASGELCSQGTCATSCQVGLTNCAGDCVGLFYDRNNCGFCGNVCDAGTVCSGGFCALSCEEGLTDCGGSCVDTRSNQAHCGACGIACGEGTVCSLGQCVTSCQAGLEACGGSCVNLQNNRAHCGGCGDSCGPGELCVGGSCRVNCPPGFAVCAGKCIDLSEHRFHCGGCGIACEDFEICEAGACVPACLEGLSPCGDRCVNLDSDNLNCGACSVACPAGQVCGNGTCGTDCSDGLTLCTDTCVDLDTSPFDCGACDAFCAGARQACELGVCGCATGFDDCDGDTSTVCEANLALDAAHCGACGQACPSGQVCRDGQCAESLVQVLADVLHGCALQSNGQVYCYGKGSFGQLGEGSFGYQSDVPTPTPVTGLTNAVHIDVAQQNSCAVDATGAVRCWGFSALGSNALPTAVVGLSDAVQVAVGDFHGCAVRSDGTLGCFGRDDFGQLGDGTAGGGSGISTVSGITQAVQVAVGGATSCALTQDGRALCWGDHSTGLLGPDFVPSDTKNPISALPVPIAGVVDAVALSMHDAMACVVNANGSIRCWGELTDAGVVDPRSLSDAVDVAVGGQHMCAILSRGEVVCMGDNSLGQLGDGTLVARAAPGLVPGVTALDIHASLGTTCVTDLNGGGHCWGLGGFANLGSGIERVSATPVTAPGITDAVDLESYGTQLCALTSSGAITCWGSAPDDSVYGGSTTDQPQAMALTGSGDFAMGEGFMCAIQSDASVQCVGAGDVGQLGDGQQADSEVVVTVLNGLDDTPLTGVTKLVAGANAACALVGTEAFCWGGGALGNTPGGGLGSAQLKAMPVLVADGGAVLADVTDIAMGDDHICVAILGNTAICWGSGQLLGDGIGSNRDFPGDGTVFTQQVSTGDLSLTARGGATCSTYGTDRRVSCWGDWGQSSCKNCFVDTPSVANYVYTSTPQEISSLTGVQDLGLSLVHRCAVLDAPTAGSLACWGDNSELQLGLDANTPSSATPTVINGVTGVAEVVTAHNNRYGATTCMLATDGTVSCLGSNRGGGFGDGAHLVKTPTSLAYPF